MHISFKKLERLGAWFLGLALGLVLVNGCTGQKQEVIFNLQELKKKTNLVTVAVLGGGQAGLAGAGYTARAGYDTVVFQGPEPGGLLVQTFMVENVPGQPKMLGADLVNQLEEWARDCGAVIVSGVVDAVDFSQYPFKLHTESGETIYALSVIIATGASPVWLGIPGEAEYKGMGVGTCAICDAPFFKGKSVIVVGGGNSAAEEAMQLARHAAQVTVVVRKGEMRAYTYMQERLKEYSNISVLYNSEVVRIMGDGSKVTDVSLINTLTRSVENRAIDAVFLAIGHKPNSEIFRQQLACDEDGYIITKGKSQATSRPGVFAAGEVEDRVYRQAITAQAQGVQAALEIDQFLIKNGFNKEVAAQLEGCFYQPQQKEIYLPEVFSLTEFKKLLASNEFVVLYAYGSICPTCTRMKPIIGDCAREFGQKAAFVQANMDEAIDIVTHYDIASVPQILVFKNGKMVQSYGFIEKPELRDALSEHIQVP